MDCGEYRDPAVPGGWGRHGEGGRRPLALSYDNDAWRGGITFSSNKPSNRTAVGVSTAGRPAPRDDASGAPRGWRRLARTAWRIGGWREPPGTDLRRLSSRCAGGAGQDGGAVTRTIAEP